MWGRREGEEAGGRRGREGGGDGAEAKREVEAGEGRKKGGRTDGEDEGVCVCVRAHARRDGREEKWGRRKE